MKKYQLLELAGEGAQAKVFKVVKAKKEDDSSIEYGRREVIAIKVVTKEKLT